MKAALLCQLIFEDGNVINLPNGKNVDIGRNEDSGIEELRVSRKHCKLELCFCCLLYYLVCSAMQ